MNSAAAVEHDVQEEKILWVEKASMKDFYVTPKHWLLTLLTLGLYLPIVYLLRYSTRYTLTNERLKIKKGLLSNNEDEIELFRISDTKVKQGLFERIVDLGTIEVISSDKSGYQTIYKIPQAREKRELLRTLSNKERDRRGVRTMVME